MADIVRVSPEYTNEKVSSGDGCLICAYDDNSQFKAMNLKGAISLDQLREQTSDLPMEKELIFYCA
ncbi:MAG: ArsR family transcriptional regulator [Deltaproteobacteria bacterium]|nr:ArsR family transcriptional regulator [Deltaproteobacteria bacterium]